MGLKPEEVPDDVVDMLMREGYANRFGMANGGGLELYLEGEKYNGY